MNLANEHYNPDGKPLRSGVGFASGPDAGDLMHIDNRGAVAGMAGLSWEKGLTRKQMNFLGISEDQNIALGDEETRRAIASELFQVDDNGNYINAPAIATNEEGKRTIASIPITKSSDILAAGNTSPATPVGSEPETTDTATPPVPVEEPQTATSVANTQTTKSTTYTMGELTGTDTGTLRTKPGINAAAGGAEITDPSMIISEDGKKVTRVAETGPEKISVMPRHKSSDVYQEDRTITQEIQREATEENISKRDIAEQKSNPMASNFGQQRDYGGQTTFINTDMPKISLSANKAFADAKMVGRFNKAGVDGDMGIVYIDRGYA
jgi:hypothetical protein